MIRSQPQGERINVVPDLTPLLDIIFIVMVFLLLTANIHIQTLEVDIPQTKDGNSLASKQEEVIAINVFAKDPLWALQGNTYEDWKSFTQAMLNEIEKYPKKPLMIAADKNARVEDMLALLALLQSKNIHNTNLVMEEK